MLIANAVLTIKSVVICFNLEIASLESDVFTFEVDCFYLSKCSLVQVVVETHLDLTEFR